MLHNCLTTIYNSDMYNGVTATVLVYCGISFCATYCHLTCRNLHNAYFSYTGGCQIVSHICQPKWPCLQFWLMSWRLTTYPFSLSELSSYPVCSTPSQKHQGVIEQISGDSVDCEAPRGIYARAGKTCQPSQFRPSSLPMRGWCWGKVRAQRPRLC